MKDVYQNLARVTEGVRILSIDAIQKANSGHPGLPLGCAPIAAYLYGHFMRYNPENPLWLNRDRFVLSAGHGSMLLYSILHIAGFDLPMDQIKQFRQLHSKTAGHPEYGHAPGIEVTTGPLGQGIANAVGMSMAKKHLAHKMSSTLFDYKIICLAGDGCIQEGISAEACSLAGHLCLNDLILIYDYNNITLDGRYSESASEDIHKRYEAYGWEVIEVDFDKEVDSSDPKEQEVRALEHLHNALAKYRDSQSKPLLVLAKTQIGFGSPNKAGTHNVHGAPLGPEELKATKENLGYSLEEFYCPQQAYTHFKELRKKLASQEQEWNKKLAQWKQDTPNLAKIFDQMFKHEIPSGLEQKLSKLSMGESISGRKASAKCIQLLAEELPYLIGGSADLAGSNCSNIENSGFITKEDFTPRNIKYGIREFAMGAMAAGIYTSQMLVPFIATFCTFSDYMRNAIRLAALSHYRVIYHFTHDSVFVGEDGPTHQPVEHVASFRAMPNLHVMRPCDANEVKGMWLSALEYKGPTIFFLTRQNLPTLEATNVPFKEGVGRGAYIIKDGGSDPEYIIFATGSEVSLALDASEQLQKQDHSVRVVSMPCWELFEKQDCAYQNKVLQGEKAIRVSIEAGSTLGWHRWIGRNGIAIGIDTFGASAPASEVQKEFGLTVEQVLDRIYANK